MAKRIIGSAAAIAAGFTLLAGCVAGTSSTPTPTAVATVEPTPTPTSATLTPGQEQAKRVVERYYEIGNQIASDKTVPLDSLYQAATGELATSQLSALQQMHEAGWTTTGGTEAEILAVAGEQAPFVVQACLDISSVRVVDDKGRSMLPEGQSPRALWNLTVADVKGRLLVTAEEKVADSC